MFEYNACWVRLRDLPELLQHLKLEVTAKTTEIVSLYMANLSTDILVKWLDRNGIELKTKSHLIGSAYTIVTDELLRTASIHKQKTPYNLDAFVSIYIRKGRAYIKFNFPKFAEGHLYTISLPDYAHDFSFKLGEKHPDDVTTQQWRARRVRWVQLEDEWGVGIQHTLVSYANMQGTDEIKARIKELYLK